MQPWLGPESYKPEHEHERLFYILRAFSFSLQTVKKAVKSKTYIEDAVVSLEICLICWRYVSEDVSFYLHVFWFLHTLAVYYSIGLCPSLSYG